MRALEQVTWFAAKKKLRPYCQLTLVFPILEVGFHLEDWLNHTIFSNLWHFPWNYPWAFVDVAVGEMQKLLLSKLYQITRLLQDFPKSSGEHFFNKIYFVKFNFLDVLCSEIIQKFWQHVIHCIQKKNTFFF